MPLTIRKLHPLFAGEVTGVDLTRPLDRDEAQAIEVAMDEYAVLVFPKQDITDEQQLTFARNESACGSKSFHTWCVPAVRSNRSLPASPRSGMVGFPLEYKRQTLVLSLTAAC